jgi:hypothetical protein
MIDETLREEYLKRVWDSNMDKFLNYNEDEDLKYKK